MGFALNPVDPDDESRDFIAEMWRYAFMIDALGIPKDQVPEPDWLDHPVLSRVTISTPHTLARFAKLNMHRDPGQRIGPGGFLVQAQIASESWARQVASRGRIEPYPQDEPIGLVRPFTKNGLRSLEKPWINPHGPEMFLATTECPWWESELDGKQIKEWLKNRVWIATFRQILSAYRTRPEHKSAGPDGRPCRPETRGLLARQHLSSATGRLHTSKEGRQNPEQPISDAERRRQHPIYDNEQLKIHRTLVLPVLQAMTIPEIKQHACRHGFSLHTNNIARYRADQVRRPEERGLRALSSGAASWAREYLRAAGFEPERTARPFEDDAAILKAWLERREQLEQRPCACGRCGRLISGRRRYYEPACRQAVYRERKTA